MNGSAEMKQKAEVPALRPIDTAIFEHPFFAGLKPDHLKLLAENAMRVNYKGGEIIFRAGDPANRFYIIESGRVSLESRLPGKPILPIQIIGSGELLGWSWLFEPYRWQFDARALEPTTAIFFYASRLRDQCEQDHDLGYELMKQMANVVIQRLQSTRKQLLAKLISAAGGRNFSPKSGDPFAINVRPHH